MFSIQPLKISIFKRAHPSSAGLFFFEPGAWTCRQSGRSSLGRFFGSRTSPEAARDRRGSSCMPGSPLSRAAPYRRTARLLEDLQFQAFFEARISRPGYLKAVWLGAFGPIFWPFPPNSTPGDTTRSLGPAPQLKLQETSATQTIFKAFVRRTTNPARPPSGTQRSSWPVPSHQI